ncbi:two-component system regulatory protein YycI [Niallia nealsonii]|uniref:Regulatory protein YycH-like domain-containing protein n=1 Tax=Niallia nealsonii TaxID=115979 RepID=A0A2N0Z452_9BACI|nr:two-component system regulatory protein YycI [Niallia nealsonii]PKG24292.1 hypothetical protein CWS01_07840 [Niallia nealsonii]
MDWNKIKTIFILAFLVLDIYLIYEYMRLKESSQQFEYKQGPSAENILSSYGITYPKDLPKNAKDQYLSAKSKTFSKEELTKWEKGLLKGQEVTIIDSNILQSILEKPISIGQPFKETDLTTYIEGHILNGNQYRFWEKKDKTITYYQQYNGKTFYQNLNGKLTFYLNEENKIVSYEQTFLENIKEIEEEENISRPLDAIYTLFTNSYIDNDSKIKKVELGYYSQQYSTTQVLSPTWSILLDNGENLFVNALDNQIIKTKSEQIKLE